MELAYVNPKKISISEFNERREYAQSNESLVTSVDEIGMFQPPIVRETDASQMEYSVVVGQRRTEAAVTAGLDEIPVLVMPWDDGEAMYASIADNIDTFRKDVGEKNRAKAVVRLMHQKDWNVTETAGKLEVSEHAVRNWCERGREFWQGTPVHIGGDEYVDAGRVYSDVGNDGDVNKSEPNDARVVSGNSTDNISDSVVGEVRKEVEGSGGEPDEAVEALEEVADREMNRGQVREARDRTTDNTGSDVSTDDADDSTADDVNEEKSFTEAIAEVDEEENSDDDVVTNKTSVRFTVIDSDADALERAIEIEELTAKQLGRAAIKEYLDRGDYYE